MLSKRPTALLRRVLPKGRIQIITVGELLAAPSALFLIFPLGRILRSKAIGPPNNIPLYRACRQICYNYSIMATATKTAKDEARKRNVSILNRKARHEYEIEETYVAGLVLSGTEIKSIRLGLANLNDSFCRVLGGEVWVYNFYIAPYDQGNRYNLEARRQRKLLLHKWQITKMTTRVNERGLSVIPTKLFFENGFAKLEIGVGRGKKLWDKRDSIAERDRDRDARREVFGR